MTDLVVRGRYQIVPEGGEKAVAHTRVTNFAKKLEDGYTLTAWGKRMVLVGAAQRTDIIASTLAAGDDKRKLDALTESAMDAAKANVRRETGTALHSLCEQVDAGMTVDMPSPWREDVEAYTACMQSIGASVSRMEEVVVLPDLKLAGRFDRLVKIRGTTYVMDIKTGANLSYSWLSIAIQLALYAEAATIYDPDTHKHEPMPRVNQERGLVIHLPAGEARAVPYWVDLAEGRRGIDLTRSVLAWRSTKGVAEPVAVRRTDEIAKAMDTQEVPPSNMREYVVARVRAIVDAGHGADLATHWPFDVPTFKASDAHTDAQYAEILGACIVVEGRNQMPFSEISDPRNQATNNKNQQRRQSK
jgi:hypothetical protein